MQATVNAQEAQFVQAERELRTIAQGLLADYVTQALLVLIVAAAFFAVMWRLSMGSDANRYHGIGAQGWRYTVLSALSTLPR